MLRAVAVSALATLTACHRSSSPAHPRPAPPAGTGTQQIDMEGDWMFFEVERLDDPTAPSPLAGAPTFLPAQVGQGFAVVDGRVRDTSGAPLYEPATPDTEDFYANVNDGRTLWFEVDDFEAEPASRLYVQAIFGSAGENTIEGLVTTFVLGGPTTGQFLNSSPNGSFRVRAGRIASGTGPDQPTEPPTGTPSSAR